MVFTLEFKSIKIINSLKFILKKSPKQVIFLIIQGIGSSSCVTVVVVASLLYVFGFLKDFINDEEFYLINMLS
jgi:hypothetical protein